MLPGHRRTSGEAMSPFVWIVEMRERSVPGRRRSRAWFVRGDGHASPFRHQAVEDMDELRKFDSDLYEYRIAKYERCKP